MCIFKEIKDLTAKEKEYTIKILKKLILIDEKKLYCDLKYQSLHKYIIKELGYSEAEASVRVNTVRLMRKSDRAYELIENGKINLTNANETFKAIKTSQDSKLINKVLNVASSSSTRKLKDYINRNFEKQRTEVLHLNEFMINKFDKLRKKYGDLSTHELIEIMLEKELKAPEQVQRGRSTKVKNSRYIPKTVKGKVYTGRCANCGCRTNLEYDHKIKYSHGGNNSEENIQMLCKNCNQRKEIASRETNVFV